MASIKAPAIGIDLGNTNCCVAVWQNGKVEVITNEFGHRLTPSCVAFVSGKLEHAVGIPAIQLKSKNSVPTVCDVKRLTWAPFGCTPEEISAMLLVTMKETAEKYLGCEVNDAVITVPACYGNNQRQATINAGVLAGLNVLRIVNEPTAGALAYAFIEKPQNKRNVLVYDLGGGTFDVSVVTIDKGPKLQVLATSGSTKLGGVDFDNLLANDLLYRHLVLRDTPGKKIKYSGIAYNKLKKAAEDAKIALSHNVMTDVADSLDGIDFHSTVTRARFEELCHDLFAATLVHVDNVIKEAKLEKKDIDEILLVGGSSQIPKIRTLLQELLPGKPLKDNVNPDEAVAIGAAIQAAILSGSPEFSESSTADVASLPLEMKMGPPRSPIIKPVIPRNTRIPCEVDAELVTVEDNQTSVKFKVHEGKRQLRSADVTEVELTGIPAAPAGTSMTVTFKLDENCILDVVSRKRTQTFGIKTMQWTAAQMDALVDKVKKERLADTLEKARVSVRNTLEQTVLE